MMGLAVQLVLLLGIVLGHSLATKPNIGEKLKICGCELLVPWIWYLHMQCI